MNFSEAGKTTFPVVMIFAHGNRGVESVLHPQWVLVGGNLPFIGCVATNMMIEGVSFDRVTPRFFDEFPNSRDR